MISARSILLSCFEKNGWGSALGRLPDYNRHLAPGQGLRGAVDDIWSIGRPSRCLDKKKNPII
jgi:hypothetical protein